MNFAEIIASEQSVKQSNVEATLKLLESGCTIPFISRYRKEATGGLDEVAIFNIEKRAEQLNELEKRKAHILEVIAQKNALTKELKDEIARTTDANRLEDLYLPYKPRRRTRAQIARENGLQPLADLIRKGNYPDPHKEALKYLNDNIRTADDAIAGASDIIAEAMNEDASTRRRTRTVMIQSAVLNVKPVKGKGTEADLYANYFDFTQKLRTCRSHQLLAILRGVDSGLLKLKIEADDDRILKGIIEHLTPRHANRQCATIIANACADGYHRLLRPSIETEILAEAKCTADDVAIKTFSDNLRQLLLGSPLGCKRILAIDPGFRTGCKVVCLDETGNLLHNDVIYPTAPKNDFSGSARRLSYLIEAYRIEAISLGNGTASRETEQFLRKMRFNRPVEVYVVNESGASVYSASKIARDEFPNKDVTVRGAVSIGRRLLDPLAELVKIEPKSIGVGQYQHDVDQKKLRESLEMTVASCVNSVGVNLNTASQSLLKYVAGIGPAMADSIIAYRNENGAFTSRKELLKVPRFGAVTFQQSAGFLRVPESKNPLDNTAVHPESYHIVERMAKQLGIKVHELAGNHEQIARLNPTDYVDEKVGPATITDILSELEKPGRDPRKKIRVMEFDDKINDISDLQPGMILPGIVNNITDFGAFVDIGIHQSGLIHLSQISDRYIKHPSEVLTLNQHVTVKVIDVDLQRNRISLTMKGV